MAKVTSFTKHPQSVCAPDGSHFSEEVNTLYDSAEFTVLTGSSDYDVDANVANAFSNIAIARHIIIRTDQTITLKFNSASNHSITIASSDSPFVMATLEVSNVYISNASGSTANVKLILT